MFLYRKILFPGLWPQHFQPMSQLYIILYMVGCVNHFSSKFRLNFAEKPIFYRGFGMVRLIVPRYTISATTAAADSVIQNAFQNKGGRKDDYDIAEQGDHKGLDTHADSLQGTRRCYRDR